MTSHRDALTDVQRRMGPSRAHLANPILFFFGFAPVSSRKSQRHRAKKVLEDRVCREARMALAAQGFEQIIKGKGDQYEIIGSDSQLCVIKLDSEQSVTVRGPLSPVPVVCFVSETNHYGSFFRPNPESW